MADQEFNTPTAQAGPAIFGPDMTTLEKLLRESEERKATLLRIKTDLENFRVQTRAELLRRADVIIDLTMKHADQVSANRRLCAEQVQLLKALRALADAASCVSEFRNGDETYALLRQAVREAAELLALLDVPFA